GVELHTLDNRTLTGELTELSPSQVVVQTSSGAATLKLSEVLSLAPTTPPEKIDDHSQVWIELADGSRLTGQDYSVSKQSGKLTVGEKESFDVPPRAIRWVRFSNGDPKVDALWSENLKEKTTSDMLAVHQGNSINFLEGTVGNISVKNVEFE